MRKLEVRFSGTPSKEADVGRLAEDRGRTFFEYDTSYLANGWSLSPFRLPPAPGLHEHTDRAFGPLPGLFDGWVGFAQQATVHPEAVDRAANSLLSLD